MKEGAMSSSLVTGLHGSIQEYRRGNFLISTDPDKMDVDAIQSFLGRGYFDTIGITKEMVTRAIRGSLCFGIFDGAQQVGFARIVTDGATFAYLCDDYVLETHRGRGLATWMMECIGAHPQLQGLRRWILGPTHDTRLYAKFGFKPLAAPQDWMEKRAG
jgi:GNAT superfamily N-acetyltransferase